MGFKLVKCRVFCRLVNIAACTCVECNKLDFENHSDRPLPPSHFIAYVCAFVKCFFAFLAPQPYNANYGDYQPANYQTSQDGQQNFDVGQYG